MAHTEGTIIPPLSRLPGENYGWVQSVLLHKTLDSATGLRSLLMTVERMRPEFAAGVCRLYCLLDGPNIWNSGCLYHTIDNNSGVVVIRVVVGGCYQRLALPRINTGMGYQIKRQA